MSATSETVQPEPRLRTRSVRLEPATDDEVERLRILEKRSYSQQAAILIEEAIATRHKEEAA